MPIAFQCDFRRGSWGWVFQTVFDLRVGSLDAVCWHRTMYDDCMWLRLPELQSLILCSGWFYPINGILITFPMTVVVHFLRNCVIITGSSSSESPPKGLSGVKKIVCRPLLLSFPPGMTPFSRIDWMLKDQPFWKITLSTCKEYQIVPHQLRVNCYSTRVSLNCSEVSQGFFGILTILESCLTASSLN